MKICQKTTTALTTCQKEVNPICQKDVFLLKIKRVVWKCEKNKLAYWVLTLTALSSNDEKRVSLLRDRVMHIQPDAVITMVEQEVQIRDMFNTLLDFCNGVQMLIVIQQKEFVNNYWDYIYRAQCESTRPM